MEEFTANPELKKKLSISQPDSGYRYSLDPFIIACEVIINGDEKIIDIGCGCGIISLLLANRFPGLNIFGVELQEQLAYFAKLNVQANKLSDTIDIIETDINQLTSADTNGKADIIVSNPPYKKKGSGRLNPDTQKAIARHEITLDVNQVFACASRLLKTNGLFYLIFP
ncbi:MAG: methyltransferase [Desulfobacula sp.]|nr:methyltransferase [Desulfobacula sp.]